MSIVMLQSASVNVRTRGSRIMQLRQQVIEDTTPTSIDFVDQGLKAIVDGRGKQVFPQGHSSTQQKFRQEFEVFPQFLEEAFRLYSSATLNNMDDAQMMRSFFLGYLTQHNDRGWTEAEIVAGLSATIYKAIPTDPPSNPNIPNFAIVQGNTTSLQLAYWNFSLGAGGSWMITDFPWGFPFLQIGHLINQIPSNGSGNSNWNFAMGSEYRIKAAGNINQMTVKFGAGGAVQSHRWEIRRSTTPGVSPPVLASYTDIVRSGVVNYVAGNVWQDVGLFAPIAVNPNDWFLSYAYVGTGSGQSAVIATLRSGGQLVEDYAELTAGVYVPAAGGFPGPNPLPIPTTRPATLIYGVSSLEFGA